jgi:hypothetical protein
MAIDLRSENDNLKIWRKKKAHLTEELLKKALEELISLNATINQKTVCDMMNKLASNEDKEFKAIISPSAISKNKLYKNMILEAKQKIKLVDDKKSNYKLDGDKQLEIFKLKTLIAKKESKIKELESIIDRAKISHNNNISTIQTNSIEYKSIASYLINFIKKEGIAYIDENKNLIDEATGDILVSSNILKDL